MAVLVAHSERSADKRQHQKATKKLYCGAMLKCQDCQDFKAIKKGQLDPLTFGIHLSSHVAKSFFMPTALESVKYVKYVLRANIVIVVFCSNICQANISVHI